MNDSPALAWTLDGTNPAPTLQGQGFALLGAPDLERECGLGRGALDALKPSWQDLPPDTHLRDSGAYRFRRHASYVLDVSAATLANVPHRAHWQPTEYNALHGGIERWFEPVTAAIDEAPAWRALIARLGVLFGVAAGATVPRCWYIEAHQFRIDTANGIGRPTPEGAHRDGVDYVAVILVERVAVRGGETRVFQSASPFGVRFTLAESWSALLLDDARVIHETTPIQPAEKAGWRDTLVVTYRRGRFQDAAGS
jgi:hypothetical protein